MWEEEGIIIAVVLLSAVIFHYASKLWSAPADAMLAVILGASVGVALGAVYCLHFFGVSLKTRAFAFVALYIWSVMGMMFYASRNTHRMKLFLGLVSQAGIIYALFVLL
jgi:hypothetical protein